MLYKLVIEPSQLVFEQTCFAIRMSADVSSKVVENVFSWLCQRSFCTRRCQ